MTERENKCYSAPRRSTQRALATNWPFVLEKEALCFFRFSLQSLEEFWGLGSCPVLIPLPHRCSAGAPQSHLLPGFCCGNEKASWCVSGYTVTCLIFFPCPLRLSPGSVECWPAAVYPLSPACVRHPGSPGADPDACNQCPAGMRSDSRAGLCCYGVVP